MKLNWAEFLENEKSNSEINRKYIDSFFYRIRKQYDELLEKAYEPFFADLNKLPLAIAIGGINARNFNLVNHHFEMVSDVQYNYPSDGYKQSTVYAELNGTKVTGKVIIIESELVYKQDEQNKSTLTRDFTSTYIPL